MKKQMGKRLFIGANLLWVLCAAQSAAANTGGEPVSWGKSAGNSTLYGGFTSTIEPQTSAMTFSDWAMIKARAGTVFDVDIKIFGNDRPALYLASYADAHSYDLGVSYQHFVHVNGKSIYENHGEADGYKLNETYSPDGISKTLGSWSTSFTVGICPSVNVKATVSADLTIKLRSSGSVDDSLTETNGNAKSSIAGSAGLKAKLSASCGVEGVLAVGITGNFRLIDVEVGPSSKADFHWLSGAKSIQSNWSQELNVDVELLSGSVDVTVDTAIKDYKKELFSWDSVYDKKFTPISDSGSKTLKFD